MLGKPRDLPPHGVTWCGDICVPPCRPSQCKFATAEKWAAAAEAAVVQETTAAGHSRR